MTFEKRPPDSELAAVRPTVAVLAPCHNEEPTIRQVVDDVRSGLPDATIYGYDNNSSNRAVKVAKAVKDCISHPVRVDTLVQSSKR